MRKFMKAIGADITKTRPVISKGGAEPTNLTASGAVKVATVSAAASGGPIAAKLVRPLAVTPDQRVPIFPDVPTVAEAGYPAASFQDHLGISGPPNMPPDIVAIWEKAMKEMLKDPGVLEQIRRIRLRPYYLSAGETRRLRLREIEEAKELYGIK
jgi:tripartite-type tricarboxylate transporter receptor subunit TctC